MVPKDFWKRKLMSYLHDPPHKPLDLSKRHEEAAWLFCKGAGMTDDDYETFKAIKDADHTASASDRFPFPKAGCYNEFTGKPGHTFKHPLSGKDFEYTPPTFELADELLKNAVGGIYSEADNDEEKWKQIFFLYWRRWLDEVVKIEKNNIYSRHLAFFPADTRIPDHTVWSHMALTSALQGCRNDNMEIKPAFLIFNVGPVQDFIAQARSTRDLWSGSYMLSWLTAHAIKAVTDANGPDSVVFPSLRGLGIFDVLYKKELYSKIKYKGQYEKTDSLWERMYSTGSYEQKKKAAELLLNPVVPNKFLALIPSDKAELIAGKAEENIVSELKLISEKVWKVFSEYALNMKSDSVPALWKARWDKQVELFLQISWQILPWDSSIEKTLENFKKLPLNNEKKSNTPYEDLHFIKKFVTETVPVNERDSRYYTDSKKDKLKNTGFLWSANYALSDYALSARRNTREFQQFTTDENQFGTPKDALSGKEEIIGSEELWELIKQDKTFFKDNEGPYGAINIIKRLWCRKETGYLFEKLNIDEKIFRETLRFDSVEDIAKENSDKSPYVAVIALDGDEMGKWISGEKTPGIMDLLGEKPKEYFNCKKFSGDIKRPLSPSYHLQFSKALANFANHLAGKIVDHYKGQLIYAGGDDVLAIVPAEKALNCAASLRAVFRGDKNNLPELERNYELAIKNEGFISVGQNMELIVPGPKADVSCGIAISHFKHPLQHIIEEARIAEKKAKTEYGRSAFAVSITKRGGEKINWGAKWDSCGVELFRKFSEDQKKKDKSEVSGRFPYALAEFFKPYNLENPDGFILQIKDILEILKKELKHVSEQQSGKTVLDDCNRYLDELAVGISNPTGDKKFRFFDLVNLLFTVAFIFRERED